MAKPKHEKRSSARVKMQANVPVRIVNGKAQEAEGTTRDVSLRGVFIYIDSKVEQNSELEVVLPLPGELNGGPDTWVRCKCRVVRVEEVPESNEYGVAAEIEDFQTVEEAKVPEE